MQCDSSGIFNCNCNGVIDTIDEWLLFKADLYAEDMADPKVEPYCIYFTNEWVLNIADLVLAGGDITNDGTKLLQLRFYPLWETEYVE